MSEEKQNKEKLSGRAGMIGIFVNVLLCTMKLIIGRLTNSISILSDGFNNLTDVGNALLILLGFRLTSKPADREHPYGHGRFEYMMSQGISLMVMYVGISLLKASIGRMIDPQPVSRNGIAILILAMSLLVKLGLAYYYEKTYRKTGLTPLQAQKADSLADVAGTSVILIGYLLAPYVHFPLDSLIGIAVSVLIVVSGWKIFMRMTSILLGQPAEEGLYEKIEGIIKADPQIRGCHDLRLHSYGPGNVYGSCDVEVDGEASLLKVHDFLDLIEKRIQEETGVQITLHPDPLENSEKLRDYGKIIADVLKNYDERISYHDLHYNAESGKYSVDVVLPYDSRLNEKELAEALRNRLNDKKIEIGFDRN